MYLKFSKKLTLILLYAPFQDQSIQPCKAKIAVPTLSATNLVRSPAADAVSRRELTTTLKCLGSEVTHRLTKGLLLSAA